MHGFLERMDDVVTAIFRHGITSTIQQLVRGSAEYAGLTKGCVLST